MSYLRNAIPSLLPFLIAAAALAQQPKPDAIPDSGAVIRTETRVVLVDTVVTDKKGNYLGNLTVKDFKVYEDNKEQQIKTFTFQSDPASPNNNQKRYIVLFFDNSTMDIPLQAQARQAAAKFIDTTAGPNRMMSIVNFGGALQIAQNFTDDAARLKRVVSGEKFAAVGANTDPSLGSLSKAAADFGARNVLLALRSLARNLATVPGRKTLILFTTGFPLNAERISEATATIDMCNRSNVAIYPIDARGLVSGVPVALLNSPLRSLALGSFLNPAALTLPLGYPGAGLAFQRGGGTAGGGGATAGGGGARGGGGAAPSPGGGARGGGAPTPGSNPGAGRGPTAGNPGINPGRAGTNPGGGGPFNNGGRGGVPPFGPASQARNIMIPKMPESPTDNQNVMHMLADGTGGFVISNTNDLFAGLTKIGHEMDEYYVLGYTPPESDEGSCHSLKVKVDQGGQVRARTGYCNAKPRDVLVGSATEKTLEAKAAAAQPGNVSASMQLPYFYTSSNIARVNVAMEIPGDVLKFEKQKGKFHAEMNVLGIAYKPDGSVGARFSDTLRREFDDKKEVEAFTKAPFHYENEFEIASGTYNLKVVFSAGGSSFGKLEAPLSIDSWSSSQFGLSGLALSHEIHQQAELATGLDASLIEDRVPLVIDGVQVVPAGSNKLSKSGLAVFYAELYEPLLADSDAKEKPAVGIQIRVLDRRTKDQKYSTGLMRLEIPKTESPMIPMAEKIPLDSVGAGQYIVELQAVDSTGRQILRTADFDLE
ncbi:MAG TPA: VWA domain-containing protein [Bryobacteraceae bacterium]|nr:VWA domain-containing protein [Bryobacteraceae bacterium]